MRNREINKEVSYPTYCAFIFKHLHQKYVLYYKNVFFFFLNESSESATDEGSNVTKHKFYLPKQL